MTLESPDPGGYQGAPLHPRALRGSVPVVSPLQNGSSLTSRDPRGGEGLAVSMGSRGVRGPCLDGAGDEVKSGEGRTQRELEKGEKKDREN